MTPAFEQFMGCIITAILFILIYVNLPKKISDDRDNKIDKNKNPK